MATSCFMENDIHPPSFSDPENRDPFRINKHLQLDFFNVIAEPDTSAYNFDALHKLSQQVYYYSKVFIYRLLTVLVGLPLMLCWGLLFGAYSFSMIWIAVPMRRLAQSFIAENGLYVQTICDAIISPLHRSIGQMFSSIRISLSRENIPEGKHIQV